MTQKPYQRFRVISLLIIFGVLIFGLQLPVGAQVVINDGSTWRSSLYPTNWTPSFKDSQGRFLHDFSYAGYKQGTANPPSNPGSRYVDVTQSPYNADKTGNTDTTNAIQNAINYVGQNGGGVVYFPAGTYRVQPQPGTGLNGTKNQALYIGYSNVVLRGAGSDKTFIFNDATFMRDKRVIAFAPHEAMYSWRSQAEDNRVNITSDLLNPTTVIPVSSTTGYSVGNLVIIRTDLTSAFLSEHGMTGLWTNATGQFYVRRITSINTSAKTLTVDIPVRYPVKMRDNARVYKLTRTTLQNVGIENLAIGMRASTKSGLGEDDYNIAGTAAYDMHKSIAIMINHAMDAWVTNVRSYKPVQNSSNIHIHSMGIYITNARSVTISNTVMGYTQYNGAGGNGYLYRIEGSDNLIREATGTNARHNFLIQEMFAHGNVIYNSVSLNEILPSDYHRYLASANLVDTMTLDGTRWDTFNRGSFSENAGYTSTQSVFWNVRPGTKGCHIRSEQFGVGYVIGTNCNVDVIGTSGDAPNDFIEGLGAADTLLPRSLYIDQLSRRRFGQGDDDADGRLNNQDNCPTIANADQANSDGDSLGNACETVPPPPNICAYQESNGQVVIEAENYSSMLVGVSGDSWQATTSFSGASGSRSVQALPNDGGSSGTETFGPTLSYSVNFTSTGTYYVSLRGLNPTSGVDDSIHVGLDGYGVTLNSQVGISGFGTTPFRWREETNLGKVTIQVNTPGLHTFNVWMRNDGFVLDKIMLNKSDGAITQGSTVTGPNASPCESAFRDDDNDTIANSQDNCPAVANTNQANVDGDNEGDACDTDDDNDNFADTIDQCVTQAGDLDGCAAPANSCAFREVSGQVVFEAEKFSKQLNNTGTLAWKSTTTIPGFVGTSAMLADPNSGVVKSDATGPLLVYFVKFTTPGTYYVAGRGHGSSTSNDSVFIGLDGVALTPFTGYGLTAWTTTYSWRENSAAVLTIPAAGIYTMYVWMREDGSVLDKFWLTTNAGAVTDGNTSTGPTASPCDAFTSGSGGQSGADGDGDTIPDSTDNCPTVANTNQANADGDSKGDACDTDDDNDNFLDTVDQCPTQHGDLDGCSVPSNSCAFRESGGTVVFDAEKFSRQAGNTGTHGWQPITSISGYTGTGALQALPNNGTRKSDGTGPRLMYFVKLNTPGTYYLATRGYGTGTSDDSIFFGLDGAALTSFSGYGMGNWGSAYTWQEENSAKFVIPAAGIYTVYVWMREDGTMLDKFWLTTNTDAVAGGNTSTGPSASACDPFTASESAALSVMLLAEGDTDGDTILDEVDNCLLDINADQTDTDLDGEGDTCDTDDDNDTIEDTTDACPVIAGTAEFLGCVDADTDTISDLVDNCLALANTDQLDTDADDLGDACDTDDDNDEIEDAADTCPLEAGVAPTGCAGTGVPGDGDGDTVLDEVDNCPFIANPTQADRNADGVGDACSDADGDVIADDMDNCPDVANSDQVDSDSNGIGDVCEILPTPEATVVATATPLPTATPAESVSVEPTSVAVVGCAIVEVDGQVVIEAENYTRTAAGDDGDTWQLSTGAPGFSGTSAMQALPNNGTFKGLNITGPMLEYDILFTTPGTYYVAVRGYAPTGDDNSVHVGLNGVGVTNTAGLGLTDWGAAYTWRTRANNAVVAVEIPAAGLHTINIWMREDGIVVDSLWLSNIVNHVPHGSNAPVPAENACQPLPDDDADGVVTLLDNCPTVPNPDQLDSDGNGIGDACGDGDSDGFNDTLDNCPAIANPDQLDTNANGLGDACDSDDDGDTVEDSADVCPLEIGSPTAQGCPDGDNDGLSDTADNCPTVLNNDQLDNDTDGQGDACDTDDDNDLVEDAADICPLLAGSSTAQGCPDGDNDGLSDTADNCPTVLNNDQLDNDTDGQGDACDTDDDNDLVEDAADTCPLLAGSPTAQGCPDGDGDGLTDTADNCPTVLNDDQLDSDTDGQGDACDTDDDNDGVPDEADVCPLVSATTADGCLATPTPEPTLMPTLAPTTTVAPVDSDGDGINDAVDTCAAVNDLDQTDTDADGFGNPCDDDDDNDQVLDNADLCPLEAATAATSGCPDGDGDGLADVADNCPLDINPEQLDTDADSQGDVCDTDDDNDSISDGADACPLVAGTLSNGCPADSVTPATEPVVATPVPTTPSVQIVTDSDADSVPDSTDNCPLVYNLDQTDSDGNGIGDVCETAATPDVILTATAEIVLETPIVPTPALDSCVRQETGGIVVIEAEHYSGIQTGSPDTWLSGGATVQAQPGANATLLYDISFQTPGTYFVALLSYMETTPVGGVALVPQGVELATATPETPAAPVFAWQTQYNGTELTITVEAPGVYTLWLALSSDTTIIDRLWLSNVAGFVADGSTDIGPAESPCVITAEVSVETPAVTPSTAPEATPPPAAAADGDGDGIADAADNCPAVSNADQADSNSNGVGNACEPVAVAPTPAYCAVFQEVGGTLVIEAEHFATRTIGSAGKTWETVVDFPGYSGSAALQALTDTGVNTQRENTGAALTYQFEVTTPGNYYVGVRGYGITTSSDSVHVGLDGISITRNTNVGLSSWVKEFSWQGRPSGSPLIMNITPGRHTLNIWMREDGVVIDKIWLATNATAIVTGSKDLGPAESPCVSSAAPTPLPPVTPSGTNMLPIANAGADQTLTSDALGNASVILNGSASVDADGTITNYVWTSGATTLATTNPATVTLGVGTHTILLTVTDNQGATATDTLIVIVQGIANQPPLAFAGNDQAVTADATGFAIVALSAAGSADSDGMISSYTWENRGTLLGTTSTLSATLPVGSHEILLTVRDNRSGIGTDTVIIVVNPATNQPPLANGGGDQTLVAAANGFATITLNGTASTDSDGTITTYRWDNNGVLLAQGSVAATELPIGTHFITLTVTDDDGAQGIANVLVTVTTP